MSGTWQQQVTLYQLRVLLVVARHRNYTHAAEELYLSQPSVSAQVHELERLVGLPLFEQVGKRLVLTQAGEVLIAHAQHVLLGIEAAADALARLRHIETGCLSLSASTTVGNYVLPKVLGIFHARYPGVELVLDLKNSEEVCEVVRQGHRELGLIESDLGIQDTDLLLTPYRDDELLLIVPPWHPWAGLGNVPSTVLAQATLLWREPGSGTRRVIETALRQANVHPPITMQFGSTEAIKQAVAANIGVAIISQSAVAAEVTAGWLSTIHLSDLALRRPFHLVRRRGGRLSPLAEAFLHLLQGEESNEHASETVKGRQHERE
ncbi:MAG: LysR family transcriptional regulator [Ktedonobacteraceae bacterium]